MKQLYFECNSGISGDMTVAALLDLGADEQVLRNVLDNLLPGEFTFDIHRVIKSGISACKFDVHLTGNETKNHDVHDHENHDHESHDNDSHDHESHVHEHRNLACVNDIIDSALITPNAKALSFKIFKVVAEAESIVHGININEVHFHEVGAVDSIVDIIAAAVCIDNLGIDDVILSPLTEGSGQVHCQHGWLPVPVPAVVEIVRANKLVLKTSDNSGEMITPTGAAIAASIRTSDCLPDVYTIEKIGIGAGTKDFARANILRVMLINVDEKDIKDSNDIWVLETNIDDSTGETLGYTMNKLLEKGALDVWYQPVFMKKNRPAYMLSLICSQDKITEMENIVFANTTTIGIRRYCCRRTALNRTTEIRESRYGQVTVKICNIDNQDNYERIYPEYESVKEIAERIGRGYSQVYSEICSDIRNL